MKSKLLFLFLSGLVIVTGLQIILFESAPTAAALPPRPTAVPTPNPPKRIEGGFIELQATGEVAADLWTVVQWQDDDGNWHDVTGWQGGLDEQNIKLWWVAEEHLGDGPFRWLITLDAEMLAVSESFFLPAHHGQKINVPIAIDLD